MSELGDVSKPADEARVWVNGERVSASAPSIAALDHGVTVGDGVFETCKIVDGSPFALSRHLRRLARSAQVLGLAAPDPDLVRAGVGRLLDSVAPLAFGRLRITLTGGPGPLGSDRADVPPTLVLAVSGASPWPERIAAVTVPWARNELSAVAGAKTTSYAENVVGLRRAHQQGAHEALMPNTRGMLCEGTGSNVVLERGGTLVTPALSAGCLAGVTRELFLEWGAEEGLPVVEGEVSMAELAVAPEVLLTSSTRDVQHVSILDGRDLPGSPLGKAAVD